MVPDKTAELVRLFQEFVNSYLSTPESRRHVALYDEVRKQARQNFEAINAAVDRGEDVTERILLKLLPYTDSTANRQKGAWIHTAPVITGDVKECFQQSGWIEPEHWPLIAKAILRFVRRCNDESDPLSAACTEFSEMSYCKGLQMGMLSPILNALRPDDFLLINNTSRQVVNYFADKYYSQSLTDYPAANATGHDLIEEVAEEMHPPGLPEILEVDLFDMFSHWLFAVKKHGLGGTRYAIRQEMYKGWPPMW